MDYFFFVCLYHWPFVLSFFDTATWFADIIGIGECTDKSDDCFEPPYTGQEARRTIWITDHTGRVQLTLYGDQVCFDDFNFWHITQITPGQGSLLEKVILYTRIECTVHARGFFFFLRNLKKCHQCPYCNVIIARLIWHSYASLALKQAKRKYNKSYKFYTKKAN